eukprot:CAMPEP_0202947132 /NCGR_PEP_ID=MMETSP1395-20130829/10848_1 /ASSEMBLY_ACC=CAM_ASM_000871 /TAXON_ID=5961 /ORGANISM="Blepharisma japonicum, Strain Stock R1072" /LENGTH=448 /DNA_ID=CAMNT_0049648179 /DNA_START=178 /DNA_END=1524 /DNA_ORIENTATION=+
MIHISNLSIESLETLLGHKPSAVLIILTQSPPQGLKELENYLGTNSFPFPIYFTYETPEVMDIYNYLQQQKGDQGSDTDQLQFSLSTDEKPVAKGLTQENYYGFVYEYSEALPTIALVTYYDAFSIVPELSKGMDANGSGVITILELTKYFRKLFSTSPPAYNLLLVLTSTGTLNFQGLRNWLDSEDAELQQIIGNIKFALCLDTLGKGSDLTFHVSRFPSKENEADIAKLYADFNKTSSITGTGLNYMKKKINMADSFIPWQHENFAKKKVLSATLSHLPVASTSIIDRSSLYDNKENIDIDAIERNIRFIAESLTRFLYSRDDGNLVVYSKAELTSKESIGLWAEKLGNYTRFTTKLAPGAEFPKVLKETLNELTNSTFKVQKYPVTDYTLYNTKGENLSVYKVKPAILDLYIFLGIFGYIIVLWGVIKVFGSPFVSKGEAKRKTK